jgi:hypothetical protein
LLNETGSENFSPIGEKDVPLHLHTLLHLLHLLSVGQSIQIPQRHPHDNKWNCYEDVEKEREEEVVARSQMFETIHARIRHFSCFEESTFCYGLI